MRRGRRDEGGYTLQFVALAVIVVFAATAGTVAFIRSGGKPTTQVQGTAYLGQPLVGATVQLTDSDGEEISSEEVKTSASGSFIVDVKDLPSSFHVTVSGGTAGDSVFAGALRADVLDHNPRRDTVRVNAVTTLAAAYADAHPGMSPDEAASDVKTFLELPENLNVTTDVEATDAFFSHESFLRGSAEAGGFDAFISDLSAEVGGPGTRGFPGEVQNSLATGAAENIAKKLLDKAAGDILKKYGLQDANSDIMDQIAELKVQLTAVQNQLVQIDGRIGQVLSQVARNGYNSLASQIHITTIRQLQQDLINVAAETNDVRRAHLSENLMSRLKEENMLAQAERINDIMTTGLMSSYTDTFTADKFLTQPESAQIRDAYNYYDDLQVAAMNLWVEYINATPSVTDDAAIPGNVQAFYDRRLAQQRPPKEGGVRPAVISGNNSVLDMRTGLMWINASAPDNAFYEHSLQWVKAQNASHQGGHNDWRMPNQTEMEAVVADRGAQSVLTYLKTTALKDAGAPIGWFWIYSKSCAETGFCGDYPVMRPDGRVIHDCCRATTMAVRTPGRAEQYHFN